MIFYVFLSPLTYICNLNICNSIFPDKFKTAIVILLYKNGDRQNVNNYRPISMLCNFSKILEKIIKKLHNKLFRSKQFIV